MPKLNALNLGNEQVGTATFDGVAEQRSSYGPPLYPGVYRFQLPKITVDSDCWDTRDTDKGPRLVVHFEGAMSLLIKQSAGGLHDGESFEWQVSNQEFRRSRPGEPEMLASDLDFLVRDAFKITKRPTTNAQWAQLLITLSGKEFTADNEWTWSCREKNNIRVPDGQGGYTEIEQKGCGSKYFRGGKNGVQKSAQDPSKPVGPDNPVVWPERILCSGKDGVPCGAAVRGYPNLRSFRP